MPNYKWTCNFCSHVNLPCVDKCSECGLSAYASAEEAELHHIPGAYQKKKSIKTFQEAIVPFIFIPFFLAAFIVKGQFGLLALAMLFWVVVSYKNLEFLKHAWNHKWVITTVSLWFVSLFSLVFIRYQYVPIWGDGEGYLALLSLFVNGFGFFFLFNSKRGKELFSTYYETAEK